MLIVRKKYVQCIVSILTAFFILLCGQVSSLAAGEGFGYEVLLPKNQMDKNIGYFHLKMEPGQEQKAQIKLTNLSGKKIVVKVGINGAKTNTNGLIEYNSNNKKDDPSVIFPFTDIVNAPKKVELNPKEEKMLDIAIKMPETSYDGQIAGGIQMVEAGQDDESKQGGATVINEYAYVVGMILQETDTPVKPKLKLNSVKAGQANLKNTIFVNYSNTKAEYFEDMTAEVQISKKGSSTVLYEKKQAKMRMAPNTQINFPIDMGGERMEAGNYTAKILVTGSHDIKEEWTKDFKITDEEANKYNERDIGLVQEKGFNWKLIVLIVVGAFAAVLIIFLIIHFIRKNGKGNKKSKGKSNSKNKKKNKKK